MGGEAERRIAVGLAQCAAYERRSIKERVDVLLRGIGWRSPARGSQVLLKPNLVMAQRHEGLACTHPDFVAAVAEWFLDHGARVTVGDSPAFGSALQVMAATGMTKALAGMPVRLVDFTSGRSLRLACGQTVRVATEALDCDVLVNLPKCKAHGQLRMSLALKNLFGVVLKWRKAWAHMAQGGRHGRFLEILADLPAVLPGGVSILDGIVAMHRTGPTGGEPFSAGMIGASRNPLALDTAVLAAIGLSPDHSPLARLCLAREEPGARGDDLVFPLLAPGEIGLAGFDVPGALQPIRFELARYLINSFRKMNQFLRGGPHETPTRGTEGQG